MKKIIYLLSILVITFSSCNPLEDIHNEIDAIPADPNVGSFNYTLEDADYAALSLKFGSFSNESDAKTKLPAFLLSKYALYGATTDVNVTFKLYSPKRDEKSLKIYTVSSADYTAGGHRYGNFDSYSDITTFLDTKYPSAPNRMLVSLTYKYYNGTTSTLENGFIKVDGLWEMSTGISDDEYTSMGEGRAQFSNETEALTKIPVFLNDKFKYDGKVAGDIEGIMYKLYVTDTQDVDGDGRTDDRTVYSFVAFFIYDGMNWSKYNNVINETIKFAHDGTTFVPDNTIKYTLTAADYASVGNGQYSNFDVRAGKDEETEAARLAKINTILLANFPNAVEGQKFAVSFDIYDGSNSVWILLVIKEGSEFVKQ